MAKEGINKSDDFATFKKPGSYDSLGNVINKHFEKSNVLIHIEKIPR